MNDAQVPVNPFMPDDPSTPEELASLYAAGAMSVEEAAAFEARVKPRVTRRL